MTRTLVTAAVLLLLAVPAPAQTVDGAAVYEKNCASCHTNPTAGSRAPTRDLLSQNAPEAILTSLMSGKMYQQGGALTDAERRAVAAFVAGRPLGTATALPTVGRCTAPPTALTAAQIESGWNGWGAGLSNTRYATAAKGGLTAAQVPKLKLKWAFGFAGVSSARAQPAVAGGRVFVGSDSGAVYSLDQKTGCTYWMFQAQHAIRTAMSIGPYKNGTASGNAVYFADGGAIAYALDSVTGKQIWSQRVDDHPYATSTGSPALYNGRLYVVTSGLGEEGLGGANNHECCTFRGSVSALDANTGKPIWKTFTIAEEPRPRAKSKTGVQSWGPAGGGIWGAPTIDPGRKAIYVATGNNYADPPQPTTDAVLALDLDTGKIRWTFQPLANDVWAGGCGRGGGDNPNCPANMGPDHDFSLSPVLVKRSNGQELLIVQQKSGMAYAIDPAKDGAKVWEYKTSAGSGLGGQWGLAVDDKQAYFGVVNQTPGGVRAVKIDSGEEVWSKPAPERLCGTVRGCSVSTGAAITTIPGIAFSVSMDGGIRAHAADDGTVVWTFDTNKEFTTVNGVKASGGAMDGPGVVVEDGMVFANSGYVSLVGRPGNVLLAFGVD